MYRTADNKQTLAQKLNIRITKLILTPTEKAYKDVYQRNFDVMANQGDLNKVEIMLKHNGAGSNNIVNSSLLAKALPNIVSLSDNATGKVNIINGWGTQRLRFLMEVESNMMDGTVIISYLQGYTEYDERSLQGTLDPNMMFYINSVINVTRMIDPITNAMVVRPSSSYNIITDMVGGRTLEKNLDDNNNHLNELKLIRPNDIIEDMTNLELYNNNDTTEYINAIGTIGTNAYTTKRSNNDPLKYFSNTVNSIITARSLAESGNSVTDIMRQASTLTSDEAVMNNPFIYALHTLTQEPTPTTFTLGMLDMIDPNVHVYNTSSVGDVQINIPHASLNTDDTQDTLNPTFETKTALSLAHSIAGALTDNMIIKASFTLTNMTGQYVVIPSGFSSFIEGIDTTRYMNKVIAYLENVVMENITYNNNVIIEAYVYIDLLGDTTISISVNTGPLVVFRFPTFCDSLYSPVVTNDIGRRSTVSSMTNVFDSIYTADNEIIY